MVKELAEGWHQAQLCICTNSSLARDWRRQLSSTDACCCGFELGFGFGFGAVPSQIWHNLIGQGSLSKLITNHWNAYCKGTLNCIQIYGDLVCPQLYLLSYLAGIVPSPCPSPLSSPCCNCSGSSLSPGHI